MRLRLTGKGFGATALHGGTVAYITYTMIASVLLQVDAGELSLTGTVSSVLGGLAVAGFGVLFLIGIPFWLASVVLAACLLAGVQIAGRASPAMMGGAGALIGLLVGAAMATVGEPDAKYQVVSVGAGVLVGLLSGLATWGTAKSASRRETKP